LRSVGHDLAYTRRHWVGVDDVLDRALVLLSHGTPNIGDERGARQRLSAAASLATSLILAPRACIHDAMMWQASVAGFVQPTST
jgi:hypothetical protein